MVWWRSWILASAVACPHTEVFFLGNVCNPQGWFVLNSALWQQNSHAPYQYEPLIHIIHISIFILFILFILHSMNFNIRRCQGMLRIRFQWNSYRRSLCPPMHAVALAYWSWTRFVMRRVWLSHGENHRFTLKGDQRKKYKYIWLICIHIYIHIILNTLYYHWSYQLDFSYPHVCVLSLCQGLFIFPNLFLKTLLYLCWLFNGLLFMAGLLRYALRNEASVASRCSERLRLRTQHVAALEGREKMWEKNTKHNGPKWCKMMRDVPEAHPDLSRF